MKLNFSSLFFTELMFFSLNIFAQNTLEGTVYLYKDKGTNTPLSDVFIKATYGGSIITKSNGYYNLTFDNAYNIISVNARKNGYEIINDEELQTLDLTKNKQQNIYLDIEGNTERRKRELLDASVTQAKKMRDNYYAILDKGGSQAENLKRKLEIESGEKFITLDDARTYVYSKYGADLKTLESVVSAIIRQNLDHLNKEVEQIKKYTLKGQIDSALLLLNFTQSRQKINVNNVKINAFRQENAQEGEKYLSAIPLLLNNKLFKLVDSSYQLYVISDTSDYDRNYNYAFFLQNQNKLKEADSVYNILLKRMRFDDWALKASVLNNQGFIKGVFKSPDSAILKFKESLLIRQKLSEISPDIYSSGVAQTIANIGGYEEDLGRHDSAIFYFKNAKEKFETLALKQPEIYLPYIAGIYGNLGAVYMAKKDFDSSLTSYFKAIAIYQDLYSEGKHKIYLSDMASNYNSLSVVYQYSNNLKEAEKYAQLSLNLYHNLSETNPDMYNPYYEGVLNNMANLKNNLNDYDSAKFYFDQCMFVLSALAEKNPQVYNVEIADVSNNYALFLKNLSEYDAAEIKFKEAIKIYTDEARLYGKTNSLYKCLNSLAILLKPLGKSDSLRQELKMVRSALYPASEKDTGALLNFIVLLNNNLAKLALEDKNYSDIIMYAEDNIKLSERAVFQNHLLDYRKDLAENYSLVAFNYQNLRNEDSAYDYYAKSLNVYRLIFSENIDLYKKGMITTAYNFSKLMKNVNYEKPDLDISGIINIFSTTLKQKSDSVDDYKEYIKETANLFADYYNRACNRDSAFKYYKITLSFNDSVIAQAKKSMNYYIPSVYSLYSIYNGNAAWYALNSRKYSDARSYAETGINVDHNQHWIQANLAHSLLLLGEFKKAEKIYSYLMKRTYELDNTKTYTQIFMNDFQSLECSSAIPQERKADVERIKEMLLKTD